MSGLETAIMVATSGLSMAQARQQQRSQQRAMAEQARQKLETMEMQREINQRKTKEKLKRNLATQRARFGASGLTSSRSADAILTNLKRQTEQQLAENDWFYDRSADAIHNGLSVSSANRSLLDFGSTLAGGMSGIAKSLSRSTAGKPILKHNPHSG